jgi:hypothetical protein
MKVSILSAYVGAPLSYFRLRARNPHLRERLVIFLAAMLLVLAAFSLDVMIETPHTVFPWLSG